MKLKYKSVIGHTNGKVYSEEAAELSGSSLRKLKIRFFSP